MNIRKVTSLTAALSFLIMLLTSIILYIVPQGRIAYWADWRLWGLNKTQWGDIHINTGILFLIALGLHLYYNWTPIINYLKNRSKALVIFTREFNLSIIIILACVVGTYAGIPPFSTILDINARIKDAAVVEYGEPPYGHAELSSLKVFTQKMKLDTMESMRLLSEAGIKVDNEKQSLSQIGRSNNISPEQILRLIQQAKAVKKETISLANMGNKMPDLPPTGTGSLTLDKACQKFNLNLEQVIKGLKKEGYTFKTDMTMKQIAAANQKSPVDIYEELKKF